MAAIVALSPARCISRVGAPARKRRKGIVMPAWRAGSRTRSWRFSTKLRKSYGCGILTREPCFARDRCGLHSDSDPRRWDDHPSALSTGNGDHAQGQLSSHRPRFEPSSQPRKERRRGYSAFRSSRRTNQFAPGPAHDGPQPVTRLPLRAVIAARRITGECQEGQGAQETLSVLSHKVRPRHRVQAWGVRLPEETATLWA